MSETVLPHRSLSGRRPGPELTISTSHEQRVLAQSFPSPSDKLLSPVSRALQGGMRKRLFGTSNHLGPRSPSSSSNGTRTKSPRGSKNNNNSLRSPTNINIAPRTILARKAIRQAYLSATKPQSSSSRTDSEINKPLNNDFVTNSTSTSSTTVISTIPETFTTPIKGSNDSNDETNNVSASLPKMGSFFLPSSSPSSSSNNRTTSETENTNTTVVSPSKLSLPTATNTVSPNANRVPLSPK